MSIFNKWTWIKRNWLYVLEEASDLGLVFVGGTALNLAIFDEYRASEDIDLYDPNPNNIGTHHELKCLDELSKRLKQKGFEIKSSDQKSFRIGPNIKIEILNDGTLFNKIEKKNIDKIPVLLFDLKTYSNMKMAALLCRSIYDARDLVDLFIIKKHWKSDFSFPNLECEIIEHNFDERLEDIKKTNKENLRIFQTDEQINVLPYVEFKDFRSWLYDWLSGFR